jgi:prepilin-type processing-associated H-X9-DG protein
MCANHLKQFGVAMHSYASALGSLPMGSNARNYSIHVSLLPYMDRVPLYQAINFDLGSAVMADSSNATLFRISLAHLMCPSDTASGGSFPGWTNYAGNRGVGVQKFGSNGAFATAFDPPVRLEQFKDSTSHTAAMSEWLFGFVPNHRRHPIRSTFSSPTMWLSPDEFDLFSEECRTLDIEATAFILQFRGAFWMLGEFNDTLYNQTIGINNHSCANGGAVQQGAWTASSAHPSGANVLFVDGHTRFIRQYLSIDLWRALGSRAGGEIVTQVE